MFLGMNQLIYVFIYSFIYLLQWHLLEHAFDMILEAGEIPHLSIFFEMLCQNVVRHNYDRVVTIVNCMGHASLRVSEKQWIALFSKNQERIGIEELQELLGITRDSEILTEETTVVNFVKSLENLCGDNTCGVIIDRQSTDKVQNAKYEAGVVLGKETISEPDIFPDYHHDRTDDGEDDYSFGEICLTSALTNEKSEFGFISNDLSDDAVVETIWDSLTVDNDDSSASASVSLSTSEILETWRKRRSKEDTTLIDFPAAPSTNSGVQF